MARRKRRGGHKASIIHKAIGMAGNILIAGPVVVPAADMVARAGTNFSAYPQEFVYSATGYNMRDGGLDAARLGSVITRDAVLVGAGLFVKWLNKRIR